MVGNSEFNLSRGSESVNRSNAPLSFTEIFEKQFPYYLSIGMSERQYWDGDCSLTRSYREAERLRKQRVNEEMWLQGMYIYDAIGSLSPILRAFSKKGTKPEPYVPEAYPISKKTMNEAKTRKDMKVYNKGLARMQAFMAKGKEKFKKTKGSE